MMVAYVSVRIGVCGPTRKRDLDAGRILGIERETRDRPDHQPAVADLVAKVQPSGVLERGPVLVAAPEQRRVASERHDRDQDERRAAEEGDDAKT